MVRKKTLFDFINILILLFIALTMVYPLYYVLSVSLSSQEGIVYGQSRIYPYRLNLKAYKIIFSNNEILKAFLNSVIYSVLGTIVYIIANCIAAYPLARKGFWLNKPLSKYYILTMFLSGGMVPTYLLYRNMGLINNILVMVLPGAISVFTLIIFKTNFQTNVSMELIEASYVDGANDFFVLFKIVIPLSKPILATFALFQVVGIWNDFYTPLLFLNKTEMYPLTLALRRILIEADLTNFESQIIAQITAEKERLMYDGERPPLEAIKNAAIIITILPIIFIYPFLQKYFAKGIMIGSLKS